jgi:hypothetical protein
MNFPIDEKNYARDGQPVPSAPLRQVVLALHLRQMRSPTHSLANPDLHTRQGRSLVSVF